MAPPVWRLILRGIKSMLVTPPIGTGGSVSARYCYSVYLRHLVQAEQHGLATDPRSLIELGPGDSIGIGLTALLVGAEQYCAIDAVRHASSETNIRMLDELVKLLATRAPIPSGGEFSEVLPALEDYSFPTRILSEDRLAAALAPERLEWLRQALAGDLTEGPIRYLAPMGRMNEMAGSSADLIVSQAVMEHVDKLEEAYAESFRCLKPGGFMSHQIDFRCHDTASEWNGHWMYSDLVWRLMRGGRAWFINRQPCSAHIELVRRTGFKMLAEIRQAGSTGISRRQLSNRFQEISESDLSTAGVFILASKPV